MLSKANVRLFLICLLGMGLAVYGWACFYALPFADDFCYGWTASIDRPFVQRFMEHYLYWNGRYSADAILSLHAPIISNLLWYQLSLLLTLIGTLLLTWLLVEYWIKNVPVSLMVAFIITIFHLCYMPNITEGAYWFTGVASYQFSNALLLLQVWLFIKLLNSIGIRRMFFTGLSLLSLIVLIGFNEIAAFLIPAYYLLACMVGWRSTTNRKILVLHFAVAIVAAGFVFFSPGNMVRANEFEGRYNLLHSIQWSTLQTIRFIGTWVLSVPFIVLSLLVLFYAPYVQSKELKQADYRGILIVLLGAVFAGSFLPYFGTGMLGQHRTINYVFFHFIFLWVWFLLLISYKVKLPEYLNRFDKPLARFFLLSFSIIIMLFSGNSLHILSDIKDGNFTAYREGFMQRQETIIANPNLPIPPLKQIPSSLRVVDAKGDTSWWVDKCIVHFYTETNRKVK